MKSKLFVITIILSLISYTSFSQKVGELVWEKNAWEKGMTNVTSYNSSQGMFIVVGKSKEGIIQIHKVNANAKNTNGQSGSAGRKTENSGGFVSKTCEKGSFKTGIWAITTHNTGQKNILYISYADYGQAEVYELKDDGTLGEKIQEISTWEKGISKCTPIRAAGNNYLAIMKPNAGWAWNIKIGWDGKLGDIAWSTQSWIKGIEGMSSYYNYLVLSKSDGNAWLIEFDNSGKEKKHTWTTNKWVKGIKGVTSQYIPGLGACIMLTKPSTGEAWGFKSDAKGSKPKYVWSTKSWKKGVSLMEVFYKKNDKYLFLANPTNSNAWIYKVEKPDDPKLIGTKVADQRYVIQSAISYGRNNKGFWDLTGDGKSVVKNGANIKIWAMQQNDWDRNYKFVKKPESHYYQMVSTNPNLVVDLSGGKTHNESNIQLWEKNGSVAQDFYLKHLGNGRFKIYHRSGKIVVLKNSTDDNGNNIHLWEDHDKIQCEWYLLDPNTKRVYIPK